MNDGPVGPGKSGGGSNEEVDPSPDRPLPRGPWERRETEEVIPDDVVHDVEVVDENGNPVPFPPHRSIAVARQVGVPSLTWFAPHAAARLDDPELAEALEKMGQDMADQPETRFLRAEAPQSVRAGQNFPIAVRLPCHATGDGGPEAALRGFLVPKKGRQVAIDIAVSAGLRVRSDSTVTTTIFPGQDSDWIRFELSAAESVPAQISVRAYALPADYLGELVIRIPVNSSSTGPQQVVDSFPLEVAASTQRSATLEISTDPSQRQLSFRLRGPGELAVQAPVPLELGQTASDVALGIQGKLDQIAKGTNLSAKAVENLLRGMGSDLWKLLIPPPVQNLLLRNLPNLDALVIIGSDDPLPWELLFPTGAGSTREFLGDQLLISRWTFGAESRGTNLSFAQPCYVLPDASPPAAADEIAAIETRFGEGKRIGTLDPLLEEIEAGSFGLLHIAAHNIVAGASPASSYVKLDQPFQQAMLGNQMEGVLRAKAPLVFLNACNSSAATPLWVGTTGWAGRFLNAGATAFIGSLWQVRDAQAREFAVCFYDQLLAGRTLGESFQHARRQVAQAGDPTRLGYTLFGNPAAKLSGQPRSPS